MAVRVRVVTEDSGHGDNKFDDGGNADDNGGEAGDNYSGGNGDSVDVMMADVIICDSGDATDGDDDGNGHGGNQGVGDEDGGGGRWSWWS